MQTERPPHPGKILKERFLDPLGITPYRLAKSIGVRTRRVSELVCGHRGVTADTAIRLGLFFGVPPAWWLDMQARYDTEGVPLVEQLRERVRPYDGLNEVLVSPGGVRHLRKSNETSSGTVLVSVPDELLNRLRAQVALDTWRAPREVHVVTYANGATALVGR